MSQAETLIPEAIPTPGLAPETFYEIVDGLRVEKPPMGNIQALVASVMQEKMGPYARSQNLGRVVTEMLFKISPAGGSKRRPDVAFVSYNRWARGRKVNSEDGWDVIPDLAIEVVSPSNSAIEIIKKVEDYFLAGVRQVWVIYPTDRIVYAYESPKQVIILDGGDHLDGGDLLPGFQLDLAELFEDGHED